MKFRRQIIILIENMRIGGITVYEHQGFGLISALVLTKAVILVLDDRKRNKEDDDKKRDDKFPDIGYYLYLGGALDKYRYTCRKKSQGQHHH